MSEHTDGTAPEQPAPTQASQQTEASPLSTRAAPVIEGEAVEIAAESTAGPAGETEPQVTEPQEVEPQEVEPKEAAPTMAEAREAEAAEADAPAPKSSILMPVAGLIGLALIGGGSYLTLKQYDAAHSPAPSAQVAAEAAQTAAPAARAVSPPATPERVAAPAAESKPASATEAAAVPPPMDRPAKPAEAAAVPPGASETAQPAIAQPAAEAKSAATGLDDRLAQAQAEIDQLQQRLTAAEAKLAAPKAETRALASPDAAPAKSADAAARLVLAQSVVAALRQNGDFSTLVDALEKLGADPAHIAQLRAGVSTPDLAKLAADFSALSEKLIAASAPPAPAAGVESPPKDFGARALAYLRDNLGRLVKVRAAGGAEAQAAAHVKGALKALGLGDLSGALAEQAQLPEAARALSADWARAARARLDAEAAAQAEVAAAVQNLTKSRS